ncbi:Vsp/OspC family lipoprotein (plasmid) [Borrelia miyamotoi]|uniref:Vsp/OspC family lipoprotein n=1 Tax=Borrelia miyamotoi TaxID=47466 RepID=A0AAX3JNT0_9SPIR|nr:Vsp/OspC family lipoprotein [Borrelia miyamotoi]WAZ72585.1 Vsp/OspC family lipoprotein [Borrelia miyamotoi]WVI04721.1 Vsp/OspC family lipoprotein [Borrelia miyamotoi]WVI05442.1 Vsp/OspC family lipoprotein [Borrelia miyamotoi]WVI05470.1 Vsp/OspC family lipoprotein [Borrelia miyamotoi]
MSKRKTLSAIIMTLFLIINIVMISCGSGGPAPKEGQASKADGTVIDLKTVSKKIKDAVDFATSVKEVETLVKSVNELAKAIGKKIQQNTDTLGTDGAHNGSLVAGAFQMVLTVKTKLETLATLDGISTELKTKVNDSKSKAEAFISKVKTKHSDLGKEGVTDEHAKHAIDVSSGTKDKGASELGELNTAIDDLLSVAKEAIEAAIKELTVPVKI